MGVGARKISCASATCSVVVSPQHMGALPGSAAFWSPRRVPHSCRDQDKVKQSYTLPRFVVRAARQRSGAIILRCQQKAAQRAWVEIPLGVFHIRLDCVTRFSCAWISIPVPGTRLEIQAKKQGHQVVPLLFL